MTPTCVEGEVVAEHVLREPDSGVGDEQPLVIVICHTATVLHLTDHVAHCHPVHTLQEYRGFYTKFTLYNNTQNFALSSHPATQRILHSVQTLQHCGFYTQFTTYINTEDFTLSLHPATTPRILHSVHTQPQHPGFYTQFTPCNHTRTLYSVYTLQQHPGFYTKTYTGKK